MNHPRRENLRMTPIGRSLTPKAMMPRGRKTPADRFPQRVRKEDSGGGDLSKVKGQCARKEKGEHKERGD